MGRGRNGSGRRGRIVAGKTAGTTRSYKAPVLTPREFDRLLYQADDQQQTVANMLKRGTVSLNVRAALRPYGRDSLMSVGQLRRRFNSLPERDTPLSGNNIQRVFDDELWRNGFYTG